ncbi:hypothetical protein D9M68_941440 [compost metagenome]
MPPVEATEAVLVQLTALTSLRLPALRAALSSVMKRSPCARADRPPVAATPSMSLLTRSIRALLPMAPSAASSSTCSPVICAAADAA